MNLSQRGQYSWHRPQKQTKRIIQTIILLSRRPMTNCQLQQRFGVCRKTVIRDLQAIEELGIPLYDSGLAYYDDDAETEQGAGSAQHSYSVPAHWMRSFI